MDKRVWQAVANCVVVFFLVFMAWGLGLAVYNLGSSMRFVNSDIDSLKLYTDDKEVIEAYYSKGERVIWRQKGGFYHTTEYSEEAITAIEENGCVVLPYDNLPYMFTTFGKWNALWTGFMFGMLCLYIIGQSRSCVRDTKQQGSKACGVSHLSYAGSSASDGVDTKGTSVSVDTDGGVTFNDIAGLKEVKRDVMCLVDFIINKDKYLEAGAKLPKGVLLYGAPGAGKTLLAKAVANEAGVPFIYMNGSDFIEKYVGVGAKRVRQLFEKARKQAPCIIFIDEIDAIGGKRDEDNAGGEDRKTLNALLTEMDGFMDSDNILVIGATNRIDDIDSALLRAGRFTDKFCVPLPETADERLEVFTLYARNKKLGDDIDLVSLAKETVGFSPAKIEALMNEAAIISVQEGRGYIKRSDVDSAMYKQLLHGHMKEDKKRSVDEIRLVAYHEAGHALAGVLLGKEITKITIVGSTSGAGGVTFITPKEEGLLSVTDLKSDVMVSYGGRVAELILNNGVDERVTTGASSDICKATQLIHDIVVKYGMTDEFGLLNLERCGTSQEFIVNKEVELAKELEERTKELLSSNKNKLIALAERLIQSETILAGELQKIIEEV